MKSNFLPALAVAAALAVAGCGSTSKANVTVTGTTTISKGQELTDLQRALDEMALGVGPDAGAVRGAALLLELVPEVRAALLAAVPDPRALAVAQARGVFSQVRLFRVGNAPNPEP